MREPRADSAWSRVNKRRLFVRFGVEFGPPLVFVLVLQATNLAYATVLFILATAATALYSWLDRRHVPYIPIAMVIVAAIFGGLTIALGAASYIELRATVVNAGAALAIVGGLLTGRLFLKRSLEDGFRMTDAAWRTLSVRMAIYLALLAGLNEVVRHAVSTEVWAWFKAAMPLLNAGFLAANWPLVRRNLVDGGDR
jgi:intracellular septation protein